MGASKHTYSSVECRLTNQSSSQKEHFRLAALELTVSPG
jgi:hypothetical protein